MLIGATRQMCGLLGKKTYDVDACHVDSIMKDSADVQQWAYFSIVVHDNTSRSENRLPRNLRRLLLNDKKISVAQELKLFTLTSDVGNDGLDRAVKQIWSDFGPSPLPWTRLKSPNQRWLQRRTGYIQGQDSQTVSYNLLSGELLVGGRPLGRLPHEYNRSKLYLRIFGSRLFQVFSSTMPGMLYVTARDVEGHQLHFGKRADSIIIRMRTGNITLEAIPHGLFRGDFPSALVDEYTHWLNLSTRRVEFRALKRLYEASNDWQLHYHAGSSSFLERGDQKLVDVRSRTASLIGSVFARLDVPAHIHITTSGTCPVDVRLPRLGLSFFLNQEGYMECR